MTGAKFFLFAAVCLCFRIWELAKHYKMTTKFICVSRGTLLCQHGTLLVGGSCPISASAASPALSLRQPGKMSSPPSEDPLASFDFLSEFLAAAAAAWRQHDRQPGRSAVAAGQLSFSLAVGWRRQQGGSASRAAEAARQQRGSNAATSSSAAAASAGKGGNGSTAAVVASPQLRRAVGWQGGSGGGSMATAAAAPATAVAVRWCRRWRLRAAWRWRPA